MKAFVVSGNTGKYLIHAISEINAGNRMNVIVRSHTKKISNA